MDKPDEEDILDYAYHYARIEGLSEVEFDDKLKEYLKESESFRECGGEVFMLMRVCGIKKFYSYADLKNIDKLFCE